ncbi:hypothetical protein F2Q70_00013069 [Brassica cretica]|uniref:Uncharacterized protein n=1 Tax=Brassica cretica TaxID=69181 RepID=A0A8S9M2S3_BRACR|nr:hypothetical protein F2Q70_00013069 [Brassica cretica]
MRMGEDGRAMISATHTGGSTFHAMSQPSPDDTFIHKVLGRLASILPIFPLWVKSESDENHSPVSGSIYGDASLGCKPQSKLMNPITISNSVFS